MKRPPEVCQRKIYEEWKVLQEQRAEEAVVLVHKGEDPTKTGGDKNNEPMVGRTGKLVRIVLFVVCSQHGRDNVGDFQKSWRWTRQSLLEIVER